MRRGRALAAACLAGVLGGCAVGVAVRSNEDGEGGSVSVGPEGAIAPPAGSGLDRSVAPAVGGPPSLDLPEPVEFVLDNGLRVLLVERHDLPLVSARLVFRGGASAHPAAQAGLAGFVADMLDEGTPDRTALEISEAVDDLGATLTTTAGYDVSAVSLNVLRPHLGAGLGLVADIVRTPAFRPEDLERVRRDRLGRVLQRAAEPSALADDAFARVLYGPDHPYGASLLGTDASLRAVTRDDVVAFHAARYAPGQATMVVVGDVTRAALDTLLAEGLDGWTGQGVDPEPLPLPRGAADGRTVFVVDKPGAAQSEVRIGRIGLARATDRYVPAQVANTVLGGSFTSRLNANLREDKGYTYGAGSYFDTRRAAGPFEAGAAVATSVTAEAVTEFLAEMARLGTEPVPAAELERARNYLALRLPQRFETIDDVVARLAELTVYDVPMDFWEGYVDAVQAVDAAAVRAVATDLMDPTGVVIVVAGDRAAVEGPLDALGVGPVVVLDPVE